MQRRDFLRNMGSILLGSFASGVLTQLTHMAYAADQQYDRMVDHIPAIPIVMFYRVTDKPSFPEDISSEQLNAVFHYAWNLGYRPVNISDIIAGTVDTLVPKGYMPLGITTDGAHPSMVFSQSSAPTMAEKGIIQNARSFIQVLGESIQSVNYAPRATMFLSAVRTEAKNIGVTPYFGGEIPLRSIADALTTMPGIEFGYQTRRHTQLNKLNETQVRPLIEEQMQDFQNVGMLERVSRIIAYPFGGLPKDSVLMTLRDLQFIGGVLTFPGTMESRYKEVPQCIYDGKLMMDPFRIPRVGIGASTYAQGYGATKTTPINPVDDFRKDVEKALPRPYVSRGPQI